MAWSRPGVPTTPTELPDLHHLCCLSDNISPQLAAVTAHPFAVRLAQYEEIRRIIGTPAPLPLDFVFCHSVWTKLCANVIATGAGDVSVASLLPIGSLINHSCCPNAAHVSDAGGNGGHKTLFKALRAIRAGEGISISYIDEDLPTADRQHILHGTYLFACTCSKCQGP
eukprot:NODE_801_length_1342_cov_114.207270_g587_i0.p1 GENE.NODE_801_length_1342_cov_114.207270_g587_i0~~NODE_801_length_1342_cov_114.207270_g587_i0.p1  ORF type:complete len:198 (+),score=47.87 NODE_801_length_1342_cov_114.207270_g587_i0:89-595(+)